jgi:hypothetical protein
MSWNVWRNGPQACGDVQLRLLQWAAKLQRCGSALAAMCYFGYNVLQCLRQRAVMSGATVCGVCADVLRRWLRCATESASMGCYACCDGAKCWLERTRTLAWVASLWACSVMCIYAP